MFFLDHIWLIPLLPAFGAAVMFFFGRRLQKATVDAVCVGAIVIAPTWRTGRDSPSRKLFIRGWVAATGI